MKIDFEMTYEEFIWICQTSVSCINEGYRINEIFRHAGTKEVHIQLKPLIFYDSNQDS